MTTPDKDGVHRLQVVVAAALVAAACTLHFVFWSNAGAMWRDEVSGFNVATEPTLERVASLIAYDSFPMLWYALLHAFAAVAGTSDEAARAFGSVVGVASMFVVGAILRHRIRATPIWWIATFAVAWPVVVAVDSVRAYGLGAALAAASVETLRRFAESPTRRRFVVATALAICSVHCVYTNALVLLVAGIAATLVCARRRHWGDAARVLAIGAIAAVTLAPYASTIALRGTWEMAVRNPIGARDVLDVMQATGGDVVPGLVWWLCAGMLIAVGLRARRGTWSDSDFFWSIAGPATIAAYVLFLVSLSYQPQQWHCLTPFMLAAWAFEETTAASASSRIARLVRLGGAAIVAVLLASEAWPMLHLRATSLDRITGVLNETATPGDLVVLSSWESGITFARHYHGAAPWITTPDVAERAVHRFDLLMERMAKPAFGDDEAERIAQTLQAGRRVFLVGGLPTALEAPSALPIAPQAETGWRLRPYVVRAWQAASYALKANATGYVQLAPTPGHVRRQEAFALHRFDGAR